MSLGQETGQTPERRRQEADELLERLYPVAETMRANEQSLVTDLYSDEDRPVSGKQLFWLRDLVEKYGV